MNPINFRIVSKPTWIEFRCPHCKGDVIISWMDLNPPYYWGDMWENVECPSCGKEVELGDYEYD